MKQILNSILETYTTYADADLMLLDRNENLVHFLKIIMKEKITDET